MKSPLSDAVILVAEDDPDDRELLSEAFAQVAGSADLRFVETGLDLLRYLAHEPPYQPVREHPDPRLILLDLNMPGVDGREALRRLRGNGRWRRIPVVVFTTSSSQEDIDQVYALGGNSYITKPERMDDLMHLVHTLERYWLDTVQLPS
jgi:two-component system, response regulator